MKRLWRSILSFFGSKKNEVVETTTKLEKAVDENPMLFKEPIETKIDIKADEVCDFGERYVAEKTHTRSESWNRDNYTFYSNRNGREIEVTLKEDFMLTKLLHNSQETKGQGWMSPTELGRTYGRLIKKRYDYNAGHSRNCLQRLLKMKLVKVNKKGHYQIVK